MSLPKIKPLCGSRNFLPLSQVIFEFNLMDFRTRDSSFSECRFPLRDPEGLLTFFLFFLIIFDVSMFLKIFLVYNQITLLPTIRIFKEITKRILAVSDQTGI